MYIFIDLMLYSLCCLIATSIKKGYVRPVRRIGTEIRSSPVRSAVSDRSRTDLGPDRFDENFFRRRAIFKKKVWSDAVDFVKKSLKSESSSRFLSCSKFGKLARHFLVNQDDRPRINANLLTIRVNPGKIG